MPALHPLPHIEPGCGFRVSSPEKEARDAQAPAVPSSAGTTTLCAREGLHKCGTLAHAHILQLAPHPAPLQRSGRRSQRQSPWQCRHMTGRNLCGSNWRAMAVPQPTHSNAPSARLDCGLVDFDWSLKVRVPCLP